jgi:hypothetical protein
MYIKTSFNQIEFENFYLPFNGKLDSDNRWVKLSKFIPWDKIEEKYSRLFSETKGAPAISVRVALGALVIKERCGFTDEETVAQICENPYLQYFLGFEEYKSTPPFDPSMMVHFRKRINLEMLKEVNEYVIESHEKKADAKIPEATTADREDESSINEKKENDGLLILDATCAPADIRYPTDISLLNEAREKLEKLIDKIYGYSKKSFKKPRTYRKIARKKFLAFIGKKKPTAKEVRKTLKNQLQFVSRNLKHIEKLVSDNSGILLRIKRKEYKDLLVIHELYRQQQEMLDERKHRVDCRIVSISQPHVRPIVRGKASAKVEFGAKITVSLKDGFSRLEKHSWENFNESTLLQDHVNDYHKIHGVYPEVIAADKIYHTKANKLFCKEFRINMTQGVIPVVSGDDISCRKSVRNHIEGKFGEGKRKYGLARIMAKLDITSKSVVGIILLTMNLEKKLRLLLDNFLLRLFSGSGILKVSRFQPFYSE